MNDFYKTILDWLEQGRSVCLATVVNTWGSSPRPTGAKMAFTDDEQITGSVSGGCIEGAVVEAGLQAMHTGKPELLHFGVSDERAFEVGLACGGKIDVFVRKLNSQLFKVLYESVRDWKSVALITVVKSTENLLGKEIVVTQFGQTYGSITKDLDDWSVHLAQSAIENNNSDVFQPQIEGYENSHLFVDVIAPPPSLVIVGGVHIAIALAALAKTLNYRTMIIDPRRAFASKERFKHVDQLFQTWPEEAFKKLNLDNNTAVAILSHDPKIDDPALKIVLSSPVFYIGALGSRKTHQMRRQRLLAEGITSSQLDKIHSPVGLNIGGNSPEEVALAIMAEIIATRHRGIN